MPSNGNAGSPHAGRTPAPSPIISDPNANHPFDGRPRPGDTRPVAVQQVLYDAARLVALAWQRMEEIGEEGKADELKAIGSRMFGDELWDVVVQVVVNQA
ncbi:hypothetical protein LTR78_001965 [Recurvomyces mirabilis]|uniref:Uncharacterized protein n=1 Tax=Recurvomyces mirabilis TaxID=574656 RepID=A0AAE1C4P5_9PEZI|nr:hypothetical protein LTR78_001965 [Recurvomyces mirabilis]KAK5160423.1 hypothetical protein LTS14_001435 [Recurvomyces mirabilis]